MNKNIHFDKHNAFQPLYTYDFHASFLHEYDPAGPVQNNLQVKVQVKEIWKVLCLR